MGIMNKMKTVEAWMRTDWTQHPNITGWFYIVDIQSAHGNGVCNKYQRYDGSAADVPNGHFKIDSQYSRIIIRDTSHSDVVSFRQHLQDENVIITYETINSVEEKLISNPYTEEII